MAILAAIKYCMSLLNVSIFSAIAEAVPTNSEELAQAVAAFGPKQFITTGLGLIVITLMFFLPLFLAAIPASIAKKKGRFYAGYYVFGYFALIPAIIVTLILKPVDKPDNVSKEKKMSKIVNKR